jgi:hypothetical protein
MRDFPHRNPGAYSRGLSGHHSAETGRVLRATVLGVRSSTFGPRQLSCKPRKPLISFCFCLFISSVLSARRTGESCTTSDFSGSAMKLPASSLGRQESTAPGYHRACPRRKAAGGLGRALLSRGGGSRNAMEYSSYKKYFTFLRQIVLLLWRRRI